MKQESSYFPVFIDLSDKKIVVVGGGTIACRRIKTLLDVYKRQKELIMKAPVPYIVARGRKGGSNIAACICNALLYMINNER